LARPGAAGVVEVQRRGRCRVTPESWSALDDVVDAGRSRDADRVADGDLVDGQIEELVHDFAHRVGRDQPS
jgi:hypothetical protein